MTERRELTSGGGSARATAPRSVRAGRRPLRARLVGGALACAAAWVAGCGAAEEPAPDGLRPGDALTDHLDAARVVRYPDANLAPALRPLAGGPIRVRAQIPALAWERVLVMPAGWGPILEANGREALYWAAPPLPLLEAGELPVPLLGGKPAPAWDLGAGAPMPERLAVWRPTEGLVLATGAPGEPLRDVGLEGSVSSVSEFAAVDRGRLVTGRDPTPADLATQRELDDVARTGLLLAASGELAWDFEELVPERLELAVGVPDDGWSLAGGVVQRVRGLSDGMTFAVEVEADGERTRAWEHTVTRDAVGAAWTTAIVDLTPWRGRSGSLHLVTEPGPSGDAVSDYGVLAGLRLRGGATRAPDRPHVVFVDVDTLRADALGVLGGERGLTPRLDAWAARCAVAYPDATAAAPWTLPSTASMFTGLAVHQHGIDLASDALGGGTDTLVTRLADAGYETRGIAAGGYLRTAYGFQRGFDVYETRDPKDLDWSAAREFLATRDGERPVFLFLHTYYVHAPYEYVAEDVDPAYDGPLRGVDVDRDTVFDPWHAGELELSEADRAYVRDLYDGLVRRMDATVAGFLEELDALFGDEPYLVVLTSDHGEAFLEHGLYGHGLALWGEVLRVPLLVRSPRGEPGTSDVPASSLDLLPTILHAVGLPVPDGLPGRPLPLADGRAVRVAQYQADLRAVQSEGWKLIEPWPGREGATRLFRLEDDPGEERDLAAEEADRVAELRRRLEWFLATYPEDEDAAGSSSADSAALDELRALGYLGGDDR